MPVTEHQRATAIRLLREQEITRTLKNALYEKTFGARATKAFVAECGQRTREIEAINATIALLEAVVPEDA